MIGSGKRVGLCLTALVLSNCTCHHTPDPKVLWVAGEVGVLMRSPEWPCGEMDWNPMGYREAVRGRSCRRSAERLERLVEQGPFVAVVEAPDGGLAVVSDDDRVGSLDLDGGVDWRWRIIECPSFSEAKSSCFERLED